MMPRILDCFDHTAVEGAAREDVAEVAVTLAAEPVPSATSSDLQRNCKQ